MKMKCLAIGIILLFVGTCIIPAIAQKNKETDTSTLEDRPDLIIVGINYRYEPDGVSLICVIQNIGTAPSEDFQFQVDGYIVFGLLHVLDSSNSGYVLLHPGDTCNLEFDCPPLFIGVLRLRCHISTSIPEEDITNNRFAHSYFIVNLFPIWFFKEFPI
jgi:hypothetical protein